MHRSRENDSWFVYFPLSLSLSVSLCSFVKKFWRLGKWEKGLGIVKLLGSPNLFAERR